MVASNTLTGVLVAMEFIKLIDPRNSRPTLSLFDSKSNLIDQIWHTLF
jgi:hypothetical protein